LLGASAKQGKIGNEVLRSLVASSEQIKVYPVNPARERVMGLPCYPTIESLPETVDLCVIVLAAERVPAAVEACAKKDIGHVVIVSGGFKELGSRGRALELRLRALARKYGTRIIGPNCIGVLNGATAFDTFFQPKDKMQRPRAGAVALLTQSGTFGCTLLEWFAEENIGVSKFASFGNKCDVNELDFLQYLESDDETKVVGMYLEGFEDGLGFMEIARGYPKPLVLLYAGKTLAGKKAARTHTGALATSAAVIRGAMRQANVMLAEDVEELFDTLKILALQTLPRGTRVGMVTNGAGPCVVAADAFADLQLRFAKLQATTKEKLRGTLPPYCITDNPIDLTGSATAEHFIVALQNLFVDENVDIVMPFFVFQDVPLISTLEKLYDYFAKNRPTKTTVAVAAGGAYTRAQVQKFQEIGIPVIPTATRALRALAKICDYARRRRAR
jgi:3-hydroxypropionyl-CoA synthetase (ADP-forming)